MSRVAVERAFMSLATRDARAPHSASVKPRTRAVADLCSRVRRALAVALLALPVIIPAALGGLTYVWCVPMERALLHTCCSSSEGHAREPSFEQPCCEGQRVAPLASFSTHAPPMPWVAPPPLVCLLALAVVFAAGSEPPPAWARLRPRLARAGPSPPLYLLKRSLLN